MRCCGGGRKSLCSKRALLREHRLRDGRVVEAVEIVEPAAELDVGHGFDVEYERVHAFSAGAPRRVLGAHQHGHRDDEPRLVAEREMPLAHAELPAQRAAALRVDDLRLPELVRHHADVAHPDAVCEARAERLDDRFLGREPHREKAHRAASPSRTAQTPRRATAGARSARRTAATSSRRAPPARRRCRCRRSRARRHHERFHLRDGAGEAVEQRLRDDRVADVELDDRAHRGDRRHVVVVEPVTGVHDEAERRARARLQPRCARARARRRRRSPRRRRPCAARRRARRPRRSPRSARRRGR